MQTNKRINVKMWAEIDAQKSIESEIWERGEECDRERVRDWLKWTQLHLHLKFM